MTFLSAVFRVTKAEVIAAHPAVGDASVSGDLADMFCSADFAAGARHRTLSSLAPFPVLQAGPLCPRCRWRRHCSVSGASPSRSLRGSQGLASPAPLVCSPVPLEPQPDPD